MKIIDLLQLRGGGVPSYQRAERRDATSFFVMSLRLYCAI